jgi:hypothetical protein
MLVPLMPVFCGCDGSSDREGSHKPNEASKPPAQILADAAGALERVHSLHLEGTQAIGGRRTEVKADLERPGKIRLGFKQKGAAAAIVVSDGSVYIKANSAFWRQQKATRAARALADRWFKVPASTADFRDLTKGLDVRTLSRCLVKDHGTLKAGGKSTVNGQPAVVIVDKGDRPGTAPGKLFVATNGAPLPLRVVATGNQRPGGTRDPDCDDPNSPTRAGDEIKFSRYNQALNITAPPSAVDLTPGTTTS